MHARTCFRSACCFTRWSTGVLPFRGETSGLIAEAILNRTPVAAVRLNPDVPSKLEEVINKALEKDRKLRYQNAADIRTDLQRLKRDSSAPDAVAERVSDTGRSASTTAQVESGPATKSARLRWIENHRRNNIPHRSCRRRLAVFLPQGARADGQRHHRPR